MNMLKKAVVSTLAGVLVLGGYAAGRFIQPERAQAASSQREVAPATDVPATTIGRTLPSFAALADQVSKAVCSIKVVAVQKAAAPNGFEEFFGGENPLPGFRMPFPAPPQGGFKRQGAGSGFIVRSDGLILTNNHVVEDAKEITVTLSDQTEHTAKVIGRDPKTDLAVLKIEPKGPLPAANLGDSDQLRVGDWVMAIGNPFGLSETVTAGIVSAKGRVIGSGPYDNFIQTDASINPGNSGGPLFNERGEVVGINSAIFSQSGGNVGIGFAIPINLAKSLLPQLETTGSVTRGWLGVAIQKITPELAQSLDLDDNHGALVADVTADGPADQAGIKRGDVIVRYDGKPVKESSALPALVAVSPVGTTVPVEVVRKGKTKTLDVTIAKLQDDSAKEDDDATPHQGKWGLALREVRPEDRERLGLNKGEGVVVADVQADSPAAEAGVQPGDVILQVNQTPVNSPDEVKEQAAKVTGDKPLLLLLRRGEGDSRFAALKAR
jgi:serine protease Do